MIKINKESPIYDRRIVLIDEEKNYKPINWQKLILDSAINPVFSAFNLLRDKEAYSNDFAGFGEIKYCNNHFRFPPQHPQKGIVYSCPDYEPDFYIPLSNFHQHTLKLKESAFIEMCGHLGAKEILLIEEVVDNSKINLDLKADDIPTQNGNATVGVKTEYKNNKADSAKVFFVFPKPPNHNFTKYENKWIESEPTWRTLQKVRLENKVSEYSAEFNYTDEMGITTDIAGKLNKVGLNIGGSFNRFKKIERKYKVIFWDDLE
ncbi:hypothetical protein [Gelidibacter gilvus]|uniref:Uncharacterized protein n=1 Tax=Gelidibacter gilvus TaxID=59602 RepID=A0A4Q0XGT9_9FLAO|nr:hypothetical protein [Gelidibacter gilvus]RXJ50067.1 hypothetical protein ESZ48_08740 [Gelidibacter gilvus]